MKILFKRTLALLLMLALIIPIVMPLTALGAEEIAIQFADENVYKGVQSTLLSSDKEIRSDDEKLTIYMTEETRNSVTGLLGLNEHIKNPETVENIQGLGAFTECKTIYLKNLKTVDMNELVKMTKLENLFLEGIKNLENKQKISQLANLQMLVLADCGIEDISFIENLNNLTLLSLANNSEIKDITSLEKLPNLGVLYLENNYNITDFSIIGKLKKLGALIVASCNIQDLTFLESLNSEDLLYLGLDDNNLTDITAISRFINMEALSLSGNPNINDYTPIKKLTKLDALYLANCGIEDLNIIKDLNLTNLTELKLQENNIKDISILESAPFDKVTILNISKQTLNDTIDSSSLNYKLPPIFAQSQNDASKGYSNTNIECVNCTIDETFQNVQIDKDVTEAKVIIKENDSLLGLQGSTLTINVQEEKGPEVVSIEYSKNKEELLTNQDIEVIITVDKEVQKIDGWTLDETKKILKKTYTENTDGKEEIIITDLAGKTTTAEVEITNIDKIAPKVEVKYSTEEDTKDPVTVTVTADEPIKDVQDWELSEDKKVLTREFSSNHKESYKIYDLAGNSVDCEVDVKNIKTDGPKLEIKYSTDKPTKDDVEVTITADKEIQEVEGWELDTTKKILTKTYTKNTEETIEVLDLLGNKTEQKITIDVIDKKSPKVDVKYSTTEETTSSVTVTLEADEVVKQVDGWTLDATGKIQTKVYTDNTEGKEKIIITDLVGNTSAVEVEITNIKEPEEPGDGDGSGEEKPGDGDGSGEEKPGDGDGSGEEKPGDGDGSGEEKPGDGDGSGEEKPGDGDGSGEEKPGDGDGSGEEKPGDTDEEVLIDKVTYSITTPTNQDVKVQIWAEEEIKETEGWELAEDKMSLSKVFSKNAEETVEVKDLAGNSTKVLVKVNNIDKEGPKVVKQEISPEGSTNGKVIVTIILNEETEDVEGWKLDSTRKILTKEFTDNDKETLVFEDQAGNTSNYKVEVTNIDKEHPEIEISYSILDKTDGSVIVTITSNEPLQEIEGWTLSKDKKTLQKEYKQNKEEQFIVKDLAGNGSLVTVTIDNIVTEDDDNNTIPPKKEENNDKDMPNKDLPFAGKVTIILATIAITTIAGVFYVQYRRYNKLSNLK